MLYLIATPIGNLGDLTERARQTLSQADEILCEDTRRTGILLQHLGLSRSLTPFHKFTEKRLEETVLGWLTQGKTVALVTDAGTPLVSDPGHALVQACIAQNIPFTALPGASSPVLALLLSGFPPHPFQFTGFLSKGRQELRRLLAYPGTTLFFDSPERLLGTLEALEALDPDRQTAVCREMTKLHEECRRGTPAALLAHYRAHPPRGEITVALAPGSLPDSTPPEELVNLLIEYLGLSKKEAIRKAAELSGISKRDLYQFLITNHSS